jgi:hypothetical protein
MFIGFFIFVYSEQNISRHCVGQFITLILCHIRGVIILIVDDRCDTRHMLLDLITFHQTKYHTMYHHRLTVGACTQLKKILSKGDTNLFLIFDEFVFVLEPLPFWFKNRFKRALPINQ